MNLALLRTRARIIREIRAFFDSRQYLSLDTPLLAPDLIPESCLEVFETSWIPPKGSRQQPEKRWLIPSPEIWMKRLIARDGVDVYQICKCFRNTESRGRLHSPEFTMLEYYTMNASYLDSLALTEELFTHLLTALPPGMVSANQQKALAPPFIRVTMEEAFRVWAGFSLAETARAGKDAMKQEARRLGLEPAVDGMDEGEAVALLYDLIFIHTVEPALPKDKPAALLDYPAFVPCLAKNKNSQSKERWELYFNGIELANCYSEETVHGEVRRFFVDEAEKKARDALIQHRVNADYWKNFLPRRKTREDGDAETPPQSEDFPSCSGVALGLDRLIMSFTGKTRINDVVPFDF